MKMNSTREHIDNFVNEKVVEFMNCEKFVEDGYTNRQSYEWEDKNYKTKIIIEISRMKKEV